MPSLFIFWSDKHSHVKRKCNFSIEYTDVPRNKLIRKWRFIILYKIKNPDLHTAPKSGIMKSLQIRSDTSEKQKQITETNAMG